MIQIEFFGIAREKTGVPTANVNAKSLGDAIDELAALYPLFGQACLNEHNHLLAEYIACIGTDQFTRDRSHPLKENDTVLLLSADAGG